MYKIMEKIIFTIIIWSIFAGYNTVQVDNTHVLVTKKCYGIT